MAVTAKCRGDMTRTVNGKLIPLLVVMCSTVLLGCSPGKPDGSDYLGRWDGATERGFTGARYQCPLVITRNGASFLVTVLEEHGGTDGICSPYRGIFTLTPEGNLKGGSSFDEVVFSHDKANNRMILSSDGRVQFLTARP